MDIVITNSALRKFLETPADIDTLSKNISLCGPTFDRVKQIENDSIFEIEISFQESLLEKIYSNGMVRMMSQIKFLMENIKLT